VLGHALAPDPTGPGHALRADLLFVGALDDDRSPNTESLLWFVARVMPRLDALIGATYRVLVAGRCGAPRIAALAGPRVRLFGKVADLTPLYASARLFVAPTRFAAGIPLKVHEAAARGVPVVATPLLAGQLGWAGGVELVTGDSPDEFAQACARVYRDVRLWSALREAALARVAADCDPQVFARQVRRVMAAAAIHALASQGTGSAT
jgi:glycosyltransferase involved in cell wall biosynthesis